MLSFLSFLCSPIQNSERHSVVISFVEVHRKTESNRSFRNELHFYYSVCSGQRISIVLSEFFTRIAFKMDSDTESSCSSVVDSDFLGIENDVQNEVIEEDPFGSEEDLEEEYVSKCGSITWKSIPSESNEERKSTLVNRCPRFNVNLNSIKTPKDAFLLYLDYSIIDLICKYTNAEGSHNPKFMKART